MINRITILCVFLAIVAEYSSDTKPTAVEVQPALETYLMAEKAKTCNGRVGLQRLTVTNVGDCDKQWGGRPVHATFFRNVL